MKKLNFDQLECLHGAKGCGKTGDAVSIVGAVLGVVALIVPPVGVVGGLVLAGSITAGMFGAGCGIAGILS